MTGYGSGKGDRQRDVMDGKDDQGHTNEFTCCFGEGKGQSYHMVDIGFDDDVKLIDHHSE